MKTMTMNEVETLARSNNQRINWEPNATRPTSTTRVHVVVDADTGAVELYRDVDANSMNLIAVID